MIQVHHDHDHNHALLHLYLHLHTQITMMDAHSRDSCDHYTQPHSHQHDMHLATMMMMMMMTTTKMVMVNRRVVSCFDSLITSSQYDGISNMAVVVAIGSNGNGDGDGDVMVMVPTTY